MLAHTHDKATAKVADTHAPTRTPLPHTYTRAYELTLLQTRPQSLVHHERQNCDAIAAAT